MRSISIVLVAVLTVGSAFADDPSETSSNSAPDTGVKAAIERLEARVRKLEAELEELKRTQVSGTPQVRILQLAPAKDFKAWDSAGRMRVDQKGIIRDHGGRPVGYWGFDFTPINAVR